MVSAQKASEAIQRRGLHGGVILKRGRADCRVTAQATTNPPPESVHTHDTHKAVSVRNGPRNIPHSV